MGNELFSGRSRINIDMYYIIAKKNIIILTEEQAKLKLLDEKEKSKVKTLKTEWKMPSWSTENQSITNATVFNYIKNENIIDPQKYRDAKLKAHLVSWDSDVPLTSESIDELHPNVALHLFTKFQELTAIDEEESSKN